MKTETCGFLFRMLSFYWNLIFSPSVLGLCVVQYRVLPWPYSSWLFNKHTNSNACSCRFLWISITFLFLFFILQCRQTQSVQQLILITLFTNSFCVAFFVFSEISHALFCIETFTISCHFLKWSCLSFSVSLSLCFYWNVCVCISFQNRIHFIYK